MRRGGAHETHERHEIGRRILQEANRDRTENEPQTSGPRMDANEPNEKRGGPRNTRKTRKAEGILQEANRERTESKPQTSGPRMDANERE
jgi:hypothetical protein